MTKKVFGLYIHIPFCKSKCFYCDFYSIEENDFLDLFIENLSKEIRFYKNTEIDTIYFGGGTPSILSYRHLDKIISDINKYLRPKKGIEFTLEANPGDLKRAYIRNLAGMGINRISLGIQSFYNNSLVFLGRRHDDHDIERSINLIKDMGIDLSIDIIWGLPRHDHTMENLKIANNYKPEHISVYELTYSKGTRLFFEKEQGKLEIFPEEKKEFLYFEISEYLERNNYLHYEVSNFSLGEDKYCRHNLKYWDHSPYLGLGPSSHSFDGIYRWWNYKDIYKYCDLLKNNRLPVKGREKLDNEMMKSESIMLGLRMKNGFSSSVLINNNENNNTLKYLKNKGFIIEKKDRIIPTKKGMLAADYISSLFNN